MDQIKWFERKFDFDFDQNVFPSIIERLWGTPLRIKHRLAGVSTETLIAKPDGTWSILENIGHLIDLEPLWLGRLDDLLDGRELLREADLTNRKTHQAGHNSKKLGDLLDEFTSIRGQMLSRLEGLNEEQIYLHGLHPRLLTPMRTMDLFLFVAEHDDHHLARIRALAK